MRRFAAVTLWCLAVVGCSESTAPADRAPIIGTYRLMSIDGADLPAFITYYQSSATGDQGILQSGGITFYADSSFTEVQSVQTSSGDVLVQVTMAGRWLHLTSEAGDYQVQPAVSQIGFTASLRGDTVTLNSRTYLRQP